MPNDFPVAPIAILEATFPLETPDGAVQIADDTETAVSTPSPGRNSYLRRIEGVCFSAGTTGGSLALRRRILSLTVADATNTDPIVITTSSAHGLFTGQKVMITGVAGNLAANGTFTITVLSDTTFSLDESSGNGAYAGGGIVTAAIFNLIEISSAPAVGDKITLEFNSPIPSETASAAFTLQFSANTMGSWSFYVNGFSW